MKSENIYDVIIVGAGAAGLFCAAEAGRRGRKVLVVEHASKIGEKIRISGGGRCNFTNIHTSAKNFLSQNPKFCMSALARFTPQDFIDRVEAAGIKWHEKHLGQLFCDGKSQAIIDMLLDDCEAQMVDISHETEVKQVEKIEDIFSVSTDRGEYQANSLVIATGGKSIPKIGATGFGYEIASQFNIPVITPRPALVPLTFEGKAKEMSATLSGISVEAVVKHSKTKFQEGFLFTHRGLSGPSILQISSYWREGDDITVDLSPDLDIASELARMRQENGRITIKTALSKLLPSRLAQALCEELKWEGNLADWGDKRLNKLAQTIHQWVVKPAGSEGYRTAEVTLGGVDTKAMNSKTMEVKSVQGLYFIGEVVDVTGWLGGYNFQWAWASAYAAGLAV